MKGNDNKFPSLEQRLLWKLQRKHLDELKAEAEQIAKKAPKKKDAYFNAEKSYQRFSEKYLHAVPAKKVKKSNVIFGTFTASLRHKVATIAVISILTFAGALSAQAIYSGGRVEVDNGRNTMEMLYASDGIGEVAYGDIEEYTRYQSLEDVIGLKGKEILGLPCEVKDILYWKQKEINSDDTIEIYKISCVMDDKSVWITMRDSEACELKEDIIKNKGYQNLAKFIDVSGVSYKDGFSNISFVFNDVKYDIAIYGTEKQLKDILHLLEVKKL